MHNTCFLVQILQRLRHLKDDVPRKVLTEVGETNDLMKEFSTRAKFEDDEIILPGFVKVDEFDDIRVIQLPHDLNFLEDVRALYTLLISGCPWLMP